MAHCTLYVEGGPNLANGDLRMGFNRLLAKAGLRRMPAIIISGDTHRAIRDFRLACSQPGASKIYLLVDLDGPAAEKMEWLEYHGLTAYQTQIFFMVQQMEAWILSQPKVIEEFYAQKLKLPATPADQIKNPAETLRKCTKGLRRGEYTKIGHGARLVPMLDLAGLRSDFSDAARLLDAL